MMHLLSSLTSYTSHSFHCLLFRQLCVAVFITIDVEQSSLLAKVLYY